MQRMLVSRACIFILFVFVLLCVFSRLALAQFNLSLPHEHPFPEEIVHEVHRRINASLFRRQTLETQAMDELSCVTGNPIDDCWRCDPNWANNRQQLANCAIGFGSKALGGKGGPYYVVTDSSDPDPDQPKPGTLRDAVSQPGPVWIVFAADMGIKLKRPLRVTSFKTIDGRGVRVEITGGGCISIEHVTNVIIHNIHIHDCYPSNSDGDGLHIFASSYVWVDHCVLSNCADGLIDCTVGSTAITISNCYLSHHDKVMLLGHSDDYVADRGMQVTVAFNRFGEALVQRMPRCRFGYFHIVNNDYTSWGQYAVGGSSNPTINSQGNRYIAPNDPNTKEVTRRMDPDGRQWQSWNWRTEGDMMVNGAYFVPSGDGLSAQYSLASSVDPKSAAYIDQLTLNAGLLLPNRAAEAGIVNPASKKGAVTGGSGGGSSGGVYRSGGGSSSSYYGGGEDGWVFSNAPSQSHQTSLILSALYTILTCYFFTIHYPL